MGVVAPQRRLTPEQQRLAERFVPLAMKITQNRSRKRRWQDREENFAVACVGLVQAAATFQPERGKTFPAFASPRIAGAITDDIRRNDFLSRDARANGMTAPAFGQLNGAIPAASPPVGAEIEGTDEIRGLTFGLESRVRRMMMRRYADGATLKQIGIEHGLSECRVSQIITAALRFLRERHKQKDPRRQAAQEGATA